MTQTSKAPSKTTIAYLAYLNGTALRPRCSYGTQENIIRARGWATSERQEAGNYKLILTDAGRAWLA